MGPLVSPFGGPIEESIGESLGESLGGSLSVSPLEGPPSSHHPSHFSARVALRRILSPSESPTMARLPAGVSLDEVVNEAAAQTDLAKLLIQKWCHGKLSAEELGKQARANVAANRGSIDEFLLRLASLNPHYAHRDLVQILSRRHRDVLPPLFHANVPAWDKHRGIAIEISVPFCLPHEWLHHLSAEDPAS